MLKSITLGIVLASAVAGLAASPASASKFSTSRTTAAECQALYDLSRLDSQSDRANRDAYISCIGRL